MTRTICFSKPSNSIKNIFTKVLKGHIAVATSNLKTHYNGKLIDIRARASLKKSGFELSRSYYLVKIIYFTSINFLDFEITSFNLGKVMVKIPLV